jgi:hypothetical protein
MEEALNSLREHNIENIVLFVGDAVRYQSVGERLFNYGPTFKTVAASLHTPASFASMLTGLNVPEHGVIGFSNVLPDDIVSLVDLDDWNTYFSAKEGTMHEDMHRIFQMSESAYLDEAEEPFVWVVRDPGGHAPYDGYDSDTYDQISETGPDYLNRVAGNNDQIKHDYDAAVNSSLDRFEEAIECIHERGIEEETLLIYASDHGELLGEYGMLGHNHVACPELVYVPTTFVHPSLDSHEVDTSIRHVDLFPTLTELLDINISGEAISGKPIWNGGGDIGYNHFEMVFYNSDLLSDIATEVRSCWDSDGGHVFVDSSYSDAVLVYIGVLLKSYKGKQIRSDRAFVESFKQFLPGHQIHGIPHFDRETAESFIANMNERAKNARSTEIDQETMNRLDDLGYM